MPSATGLDTRDSMESAAELQPQCFRLIASEVLLSGTFPPLESCVVPRAHPRSRRLSMTAELIHRLHFAFTITFHYLFPQLTMGLAC